jgi:phage tail sheath gpL-like
VSISFNNIPDSIRTPGTYAEVDNSRALQGLVQNPHKALIIGQKLSTGSATVNVIQQVTSNGLADGFFGTGSILARMCNVFKSNNPNTELHALALSISAAAGVRASGIIKFDSGLSATADCNYYLMVAGQRCYVTITSAMSVANIAAAIVAKINSMNTLPVSAAVSASAAGSDHIVLTAKLSGTLGNYIDVRANYYTGQSNPAGWSVGGIPITPMAGGTTDPELSDAWAVIDGQQYHYIIQPYIDAANLTSLENELTDRFGPLIDLQGHGIGALRGTQASCTTTGNSRNSPHNTIIGAYDSPTCPEEWAAAAGAVIGWNLNNDPARPLYGLKLKDVLAPPAANRFTRAERDILLYDGISTWVCDSADNVLLERAITTYQTNVTGSIDPSYLDICTLATLGEIRYQYKARMSNRFITQRFKLADDSFPVQPGSYVVTSKTIKQEIIALFALLQDEGLIENLNDFVTNLIVQRNATDKTRVDVLLPPDLINQFDILATSIQFIL